MEIFVIKRNHINGAVITTPYRSDEHHVALFDASQYNLPNVAYSAEVVLSA